MRVIVIGGGAIGLCVAESLHSRGAEVTVLERGRCGEGASAGNAGWVTPSLSIPVPGPGVIGESLRWLVNPSGPLWIRPTLEPSMLGWIASFAGSCRPRSYRSGLAVLQRAAAIAGVSFDRLGQRGVEFELHDDPLLYPAFDADELRHLQELVAALRAAGSAQRLAQLTTDETLEVEPALDPRVVGAVIAHGERRVRPELLTAGLRTMLIARGVEIREHSPVAALASAGSRWMVDGGAGGDGADAIVLAGGIGTTRLLAGLGTRLPVLAAKGYSRTYRRDSAAESGGPKGPLYLESPKVAISVFDDCVRVSGTLELGARGLALSSRRLAAISSAAARALPGWTMSQPTDWAGMRSLSPDGLPFIGAVPDRRGLYVATAHATLGITLAPLTGELLAGLIVDGSHNELTAAFDPARATSRRGPKSVSRRASLSASQRAPLSASRTPTVPRSDRSRGQVHATTGGLR
jgi:D-amino-acid dehydrogenase